MKLSFFKKILLLFLFSLFIILELFILTVFSVDFFGFSLVEDYILYIFLGNCFLIFIFFFYIFKTGFLTRINLYKSILPILNILATYAFVFFSPNINLGQLSIAACLVSNYVLLISIEKTQKVVFINLISFFTVFLFYFYAYSSIIYLVFSYSFMVLLLVIFSSLILYYKVKSIEMDEKYRRIFIITFALIVAEFFLVFFFMPIKSIFIKSLFLVFVYYSDYSL